MELDVSQLQNAGLFTGQVLNPSALSLLVGKDSTETYVYVRMFGAQTAHLLFWNQFRGVAVFFYLRRYSSIFQ